MGIGEKRTSCGSGDAGAGHDHDAADLARLDVVGDGGEAALGQGLGRGVVGHERLLLAHLGVVAPVAPASSAVLLLGLGLDAEVVEVVKAAAAVVVVKQLLAPARARPCAVLAAYLGGASADVPCVSGRLARAAG